jgi:hypothetical protein
LNKVKENGISKSGGGSGNGFSIKNFKDQHCSSRGHILNREACVLLLPRILKPCFSTRHIRAFAAQPAKVDDLPADDRPLTGDPATRIQLLADLDLLTEFTTNAKKKTVKCSVCFPAPSYDLMTNNIVGSLRHHRLSPEHAEALQVSRGQRTLFGNSVVMPPSSSRRQ